jgi:hypothetical protein
MRRHNIAYRLALRALRCSCNMERDGSRRLNLAMAIKNDMAGRHNCAMARSTSLPQ